MLLFCGHNLYLWVKDNRLFNLLRENLHSVVQKTLKFELHDKLKPENKMYCVLF